MNEDQVIIEIDEKGNVSAEVGASVKGSRCEQIIASFAGLGEEKPDARKRKAEYWQRENKCVQQVRRS